MVNSTKLVCGEAWRWEGSEVEGSKDNGFMSNGHIEAMHAL